MSPLFRPVGAFAMEWRTSSVLMPPLPFLDNDADFLSRFGVGADFSVGPEDVVHLQASSRSAFSFLFRFIVSSAHRGPNAWRDAHASIRSWMIWRATCCYVDNNICESATRRRRRRLDSYHRSSLSLSRSVYIDRKRYDVIQAGNREAAAGGLLSFFFCFRLFTARGQCRSFPFFLCHTFFISPKAFWLARATSQLPLKRCRGEGRPSRYDTSIHRL